MTSGRLVQLGPAQAEEASRFAAQHPHACAFIAGWLAEGGLARDPRTPRAWLFAERRGAALEGLAYVSDTGIVIPALKSPEALEELAELGRANPNAMRVLVGEREQIASLWGKLSRAGSAARIVRDQLGYSVARGELASDATLPLVAASDAQLEQVVAASAEMAREEAGDDPQRRNPPLFRARIRERMARGRDFIHLEAGRLVFKANVSALSAVGGQVEGIYTVPERRGEGFGTRGTAEVTRWVLERSERAFLLVNDDNLPAIRLYERLGYRRVLESRTIFVAP